MSMDATEEVDPQMEELVNVHGRRFQRFSLEHQIHYMPADDEEAKRLNQLHQSLSITFDHRLIFPPIINFDKVLDLGFGSGAWAIEVARTYPHTTVIGVDISAHMLPDDYPYNFEPQLDDLNKRFTFRSNSFDIVHSRLVAAGINKTRWPSYLRDIYRVLKPGGWAQMVECYHQLQSDNGSVTDGSAMRQWSERYIQSIEDIKEPRVPMQLQHMLPAAGFVAVEWKMVPLPLSNWSADNRENRIGETFRADVMLRNLKNMVLGTFTQRLGMSIEEVDDLCRRAAQEALDRRIKAYIPIYVCIGQKPLQ